MLKYISKRVLMGLIALFVVAVLTFFLMYLVPGGPFVAEKSITPQAKAALDAKFGLDKPLLVQFKNYVLHALQGDFGPSIKQRGRDVIDIILTKFPISAKLGGISVLVALVLGVPLGCIAAFKRGKWGDNLIRVIATLGIAVPGFVLATLLLYYFTPVKSLFAFGEGGLKTFRQYILPVTALAFYPMAYIARLMRSTMLDTLGQDYIRTAIAKGVPRYKVLFKHALRNAILPIITYVGPLTAFTITGSFVVESIFTIPGLGFEFVNSIIKRDYTMIMGTTIFLAAIMITLNVLVDVAYKFVDPRIKLN
ncbi:MAG: ABC transporter permease [Firmicutes bacterium]|nr:ABC transporter permease [Bacillota bacterium]